MRIAIASGKGGTGKTTVATNLARAAADAGYRVVYLDCDVEEPNGHIFLKPAIRERRVVTSAVPEVDAGACSLCGRCGAICQYSAIVCVGDQVLVYPELCHACGGCMLVCPERAISERPRGLGVVESGEAGAIRFVRGLLHVGEPMSPPLIRAVKQEAASEGLTLVDAPPGTSCPVIEAVRGADFVVLVTEPTPFGFHDLKLAVEVIRVLGIPLGVVVNRADLDGRPTRAYCAARRIPILLEIPDDRRIAEAYSRGELACDALPEYKETFRGLLESIWGDSRVISA